MSTNVGLFINRACGLLMTRTTRPPFLILSRTLVPNLYGYITKKKRIIRERSKSLDWAAPILNSKDKVQEEEPGTSAEPHMLHVVYLTKLTNGRPWWEKEIVKKLNLEGKVNQPVIHKNTPSINRMLNEIKHLVKILPLKFPNGLPEDESDWEHSRINSRGEMVVIKRLKTYEPDSSVAPDPDSEKWKLDLDTLRKDLDKKCTDYNIHTEYKPAEYTYRRNQDKKMYRYNHNKDVPKYEW